jgi:hypothetical protein
MVTASHRSEPAHLCRIVIRHKRWVGAGQAGNRDAIWKLVLSKMYRGVERKVAWKQD